MTRSRMLLLLPVFWLPALWANQAVGQLTGVVLHTPPLWADYFVCSVVNSSTSNRLVTAKILDKNGLEMTTNPIAGGCTQATLNPGQACGVIASGNGVQLGYCKIGVPLALKQDVRGSLYASKQNGATAVVVQAE
jgi:hypothetical protein